MIWKNPGPFSLFPFLYPLHKKHQLGISKLLKFDLTNILINLRSCRCNSKSFGVLCYSDGLGHAQPNTSQNVARGRHYQMIYSKTEAQNCKVCSRSACRCLKPGIR